MRPEKEEIQLLPFSESVSYAYQTFLFIVVRHVRGDESFGTFCPGQWVLETVQEIDQTPRDDRVVVESNDEANYS